MKAELLAQGKLWKIESIFSSLLKSTSRQLQKYAYVSWTECLCPEGFLCNPQCEGRWRWSPYEGISALHSVTKGHEEISPSAHTKERPQEHTVRRWLSASQKGGPHRIMNLDFLVSRPEN